MDIRQQNQQNQNNEKEQNQQISVNAAKAWRNEAEALERSSSHLNKIDKVLAESSIEKVDNKEVINLDKRDFQAMQKDREEFKQKHSQSEDRNLKENKEQAINNTDNNVSQNFSNSATYKI